MKTKQRCFRIKEMLKEPKQARVYEGYTTQMVLNASNDSDKVKTDVYQKKGQKRWRYRDIEEGSLPAHVEGSKSDWKSLLKEKKPSTSLRSRHKATKCDSRICTYCRSMAFRYGGSDEQIVKTLGSSRC